MKRKLLIILVTMIGLGMIVSTGAVVGHSTAMDANEFTCEYPQTLTDATGEEVTIEEEPDSIVALHGSDVQTLFEIGAEDSVVGMPIGQYTDYVDAGDRTDISTDDDITIVEEEVIALEPDIVIGANTVIFQDGLVEQLRDAGLTVYVFDVATSIEDIKTQTQITGSLSGECEGAEETVEWMDDRLSLFETVTEDEERPVGFYTMGDDFTPGTDTFQHEILTSAGLTNIAELADIEGWGQISEEVVLAENPEWIIHGESIDPPMTDTIAETTAGEEEQFIAVHDNFISQPAPGVITVIDTIVQTVHEDAYEAAETDDEADVDDAPEDDITDDAMDDDHTDEDDDVTVDDDSIPGYGIPIAIIAFASTLVAIRFRG